MGNTAFYATALSFFVGVFTASASEVSFVLLAIGLTVGTVAWALAFRRNARIALASACLCLFALGALRAEWAGRGGHSFDAQIGVKAAYRGVVCAEPEPRDVDVRFRFCLEGSEDRVLVTAARYPEYHYGDVLELTGRIELPENFEAYPGGPEFDYVSYLAKDQVRYLMKRPTVTATGENRGSAIVRGLIALKSAFVGRVQALFPEPEASLLGGILLGEKGSLPEDVSDDFKAVGLTHILVLSGSNVTVVADAFLKAFSALPRALGQGLGALSIILFAVMTGASSTTVRATSMALIALVARSVSRRSDASRALTVAAVCMVMHNPLILAFDVSFQLSLLATLALIYVSPLVSDRLGFVTERFGLREMLSATVSTQVFTAPFILYKMGVISVVSLVPNLLALPAVPPAMAGGFAAAMAGFASETLALPLAWGTTALLSWVIKVAGAFGALPFAALQIQASPFGLACAYAVIVALLVFGWRRKAIRDSSPPPSAS